MLSIVRTNLSLAKLSLEKDIEQMPKNAFNEEKVARLRKILGQISAALYNLEREM